MAKTEKLFHPATGLYQDIPVEYIDAHLANGWVYPESEKPVVESETTKEGKRK